MRGIRDKGKEEREKREERREKRKEKNVKCRRVRKVERGKNKRIFRGIFGIIKQELIFPGY